MRLHNYFNSSTSYRVRVAMNLKGVDYTYIPVNLRASEHRSPDYLALNPAGGVPLLIDGDVALHQSIAIIDWLDHRVPEPRMIPEDPLRRARTLELSLAIACDIHPVNNLRLLKYLEATFNATELQRRRWYEHWVHQGFAPLEALLRNNREGKLCFGDFPTLAECCLVPQITNALRMGCDLNNYPLLLEIFERCMAIPAFQNALPKTQPDFAL